MEREAIRVLAEQRLAQRNQEQVHLVESWDTYIKEVADYRKEEYGESMDDYQKMALAQCLENAFMEGACKKENQLLEATTEDSITFLGIQLPVIAALLPALAMNELATIQALDRRMGAVFFFDVKYGSTKGSVTTGDTMISARTGHSRTEAQRMYASTTVVDEAVAGSAGASATVTGTLAYAPGVDVTHGTTVVKDGAGTVIGHDRATAGTVTGSNCTGTVTAAGAYSLTPVSSWDSNGITITYEYQYDLPVDTYNDRDGVPQVNISVTSEEIRAVDFPLRAFFSMGASFDLQKAHGINLESELIKYMGGEVKFTIDHHGIDLIDDCAVNGVYVNNVLQSPAAAIGSWDASLGTGQEWVWKRHEFIKKILAGDLNIINATLRARASWIVVGNNVAALMQQFGDDHFKPIANLNSVKMTGPLKIGSFMGRSVVQDPLLVTRGGVAGANRYVMGWRGSDFLDAAFVYAPYIPLFSTPTIYTSDLFGQKGFMSSAGFKVINAGMFTYGSIANY